MKKPIFLLLTAVLATLLIGALIVAKVQLREAVQVQEVVDAPVWFFNPAQGEYVGVSLPLESPELAQQQAVYAALLSYVAQSKVEMGIKRMMTPELAALIGVQDYVLRCNLPSSYKVIKTAVNQYGEQFVSLNVTPSLDSSIQVVVKRCRFLSMNEGFENLLPMNMKGIEKYEEEIMFFAIEDTSPSRIKVHVDGSYSDSAGFEEVEYGIQRAGEKETFVPEKKYDYRSTMSSGTLRKATRREPFWGKFTLRHSLGVAYTQALLNGIIDDCASIGRRGRRYPGDITKPARKALRVEIVEGSLVLFTKSAASKTPFFIEIYKPERFTCL